MEWVDKLNEDLRSEFDRLRKVGVKFSISTSRLLSLTIIDESTNGLYVKGLIYANSGMKQVEKSIYDGLIPLWTDTES